MNKITYPLEKNIFIIESLKNKITDLELFFEREKDAIFIVNGGACFSNEEKEVKFRIDKILDWKKKYKLFYNKDYLDLIYLNQLKKELNFSTNYEWIDQQKAYTKIDFTNQTSIMVISGGFNNNLNNDIELCFTDIIENIPWHKYYDGQLGFIISNNPKSNQEEPIIWDYSCSIGISNPDKIIIQRISSKGLMEFFTK